MTPVLIGYFPKRTMKRPEWLKATGVEELCSVSTCLSDGPNGWVDQWRHNEMWVYDTPELAFSVVPEATRKEFDLYAYKMFPVVFVVGKQQPFDIPNLHVQSLASSFERLGNDIVCKGGCTFACSPLTCNHMAEHVAVNRQCLVEDAAAAFRLAAEFEAGGCEPGPYCVVEVWRLKHAG